MQEVLFTPCLGYLSLAYFHLRQVIIGYHFERFTSQQIF